MRKKPNDQGNMESTCSHGDISLYKWQEKENGVFPLKMIN